MIDSVLDELLDNSLSLNSDFDARSASDTESLHKKQKNTITLHIVHSITSVEYTSGC